MPSASPFVTMRFVKNGRWRNAALLSRTVARMPGSILRTTRRRASDAADGYPDREHPGSSSPLRDAAHGRAIALDAALRLRHRVRREPKENPIMSTSARAVFARARPTSHARRPDPRHVYTRA